MDGYTHGNGDDVTTVRYEWEDVPAASVEPSGQLKLDIGCGKRPREGFTGVDRFPPADGITIDVLRGSWPWPDNSVDAIVCSHFIEHIPMTERGGLDLLCAFVDDCYRVLKPGGTMELIWPALQSVRAFQDPTHRRFIPLETMLYFDREWRRANQLEHYLGSCDFVTTSSGYVPSPAMSDAAAFGTQEAIGGLLQRSWGMAIDYTAILTARKA